jgi:hypothetical protein
MIFLPHFSQNLVKTSSNYYWILLKHSFQLIFRVSGIPWFLGLSAVSPCGGEFEYLHRNPASGRRRQKGNSVPGAYKYGDLALQAEGVSHLREWSLVMSPVGLGPENYCAGEAQQQCSSYRQRGRFTSTNPQLTVARIRSRAQNGGLTPKQAGRLTVGRNIILTLT